MKNYNKDNIQFARELRNNMTPWERKLWYMFLRSYPVRFQRQKVLGNYIVDFYCAKAKLVIEIDDSGHYELKQHEYDISRTEYLKSTGLTVIRLLNTDIDKKFSETCEYIHQYINSVLGSP